MAEQRRYTEAQKQRILASGERPPEPGRSALTDTLRKVTSVMPGGILPAMLLGDREFANAAVALPRAVTDTVATVGMAVPAARAALDSEVDFPEAMMGKEGLAEFNNYVQSNTQALLDQLPEERRTQANAEAIANAFMTSGEAEAIRLKHSNPLIRAGTEGGNAINDAFGLNRVSEETSVDDLEQIIAGSVIPIGGLGKAASSAASSGIRRAGMKALELALPGSSSVGNAVANVGAQEALSQGMRYAMDAPSVITGDALGPEQGITAAYDPDIDPDAGMNGEQAAAIASGVGGLAVAAAVMFGKTNKAMVKPVMDAIDKVDVLDDGDVAEFRPTLTKGQRIKAEIEGSAPLRDAVRNAKSYVDEVSVENKVAEIERVTNNTAYASLNTSQANALDLGIVPALERKTIPISFIKRGLSELPPEDFELFNKAMLAKTRLDEHNLRIQSVQEDELAAKMGLTQPGGMAKFKAIQKKGADLVGDDTQIAGGMTVKEAKALVSAMDAHPVLPKFEKMYRQVTSDILDAKLADTQLAKADIDKVRKSHPNYMMVQEASSGNWWDRVKDSVKGTGPTRLFENNRSPLYSRDPSAVVENPADAITALEHYMFDHVRYTRFNEATRSFVNAMKGTDEWGKSIRNVKSMSLEEFRAKGWDDKLKADQGKFAYTEGGQIHLMEAADPEVLRALKFNPPATAAVFNIMRKMKQHGTTGTLRPEFAPTAALYEDGIAKLTRKSGRAYGLIDSTLRKALPNSTALARVLDKWGDPTSQIQMLAGLFQMTRHTLMREAATKMANDLALKSGFFNLMSQTPMGRQAITRAADAMLRSYNQSRFAVYVNEGIKQSNLMDDPIKNIRQGYDAATHLSKAVKPLSVALEGYKSMLEMVHNTSKYAFFAQNYASLQRKYGGAIPKDELNRLVKETKLLSGDMTRAPGAEWLSKTASAFPYAHIAINSTYHLASAAKHSPATVGARILTGHVLPKVAAIALISQNQELSDWYWNKLPSWQRISRIPFIGPDWWIDQAQGNQRALTSNDIYLMPEAPEMVPISNMMVAGLRSLGLFGDGAQKHSSFAKELGEGLESVTSVGVPPLVTALAGGARIDMGRLATMPLTGKSVFEEAYDESPHQGLNTTGMTADSDFSRSFSGAMVGLFGTAIDTILESTDTAIQAMNDGDGFTTALGKAMEFSAYQMERGLPELPGTREAGAFLYTSGQRRRYASTDQRVRVVDVLRKFEPIERQLSADNDKRGTNKWAEGEGLDRVPEIGDPRVAAMAKHMNSTLNTGKMKALAGARTELNMKLGLVDNSKDNMSPAEYHLRYNSILSEMDQVNAQQEDIINQLETQLHRQYGVDIDGAIEAIEQSLTR